MEEKPNEKKRPILLLNGDLLGLAAGALVGGMVLSVGFYIQQLDGMTAAIRSGLAFVIAYAVVFIFVKYVLRTLIYEMAQQRVAAMEQAARSAEPSGTTAENPGEQQ